MREPKSELDVVYSIGKHWREIKENSRLEHIEFHDGSYDATGIFEDTEVTIEVEQKGSDFFRHGHGVGECDLVICWVNNRSVTGVGGFKTRKWKTRSENPDPAFEDVDIDVIELRDLLVKS